MKIGIITPVWNDWESALKLFSELDEVLFSSGHQATLWFVDDGSTEQLPELAELQNGRAISEVFSIELKNNQGHQRAIATALAYHSAAPFSVDGILIMDCDGEDNPSCIPALLESSAGNLVAVARRARRFERALFRTGYIFYRALFYLSTGKSIRFGNFLFLPARYANLMGRSQYSTIHLAAAVLRLQLPSISMKVDRGRRYAGSSRMNFASLVMHGLNAISVFSDVALSRLIVLTVVSNLICLLVLNTLISPEALAGMLLGAILLCFQLFFLHRSNERSSAIDPKTHILRVRKLSVEPSTRLEVLALRSRKR